METVVVHTTYDDMEAEMIRNLLDENDIQCQVVSEITHAVFPLVHDHRLAKIRIIVGEQEVQRAEEIITGFLNSPEPSFDEDELLENDDSDQDSA
ncbi:DUF2007 domain-containing protein [bacterium]|nr:DUF2007 domain-containing protein [candidate division CSSED10-310 bacterium]